MEVPSISGSLASGAARGSGLELVARNTLLSRSESPGWEKLPQRVGQSPRNEPRPQ